MFHSTERRKIDKLDFIVAGAQKCGTTALHYFLQKHPHITMGDRQEMHFFDDDEFFSQRAVDYELLHRHFPAVASSTRLRYATARQAIAGESTPSYLYYEPAMERIWNYNPQIKLLILLRNPVERAFAHWNMQRFKGREPLDFLDAVKNEKNRVTEASPLQSRRFSYVDRGFYCEQLERVWKFFAKEQVKVIKSEEFQKNNRETLNSIFQFLGVKPLRMIRSKDRNVVPYERAVTSEERGYLYRIFAEEIVRLEGMLGWDCSDWKL
jgi:hypothetical protein